VRLKQVPAVVSPKLLLSAHPVTLGCPNCTAGGSSPEPLDRLALVVRTATTQRSAGWVVKQDDLGG